MNKDENELLDIFVEVNTAYKSGKRVRMGTYADRAITLLGRVKAEGFVDGYLSREREEKIPDDLLKLAGYEINPLHVDRLGNG